MRVYKKKKRVLIIRRPRLFFQIVQTTPEVSPATGLSKQSVHLTQEPIEVPVATASL